MLRLIRPWLIQDQGAVLFQRTVYSQPAYFENLNVSPDKKSCEGKKLNKTDHLKQVQVCTGEAERGTTEEILT